jgi:hypothetical protein
MFNWGNVHVCAARKLVDTSEPPKEEGAEEVAVEEGAAPAQLPSEAGVLDKKH